MRFEQDTKFWDPRKVLECGQFFHWDQVGYAYRIVHQDAYAIVESTDDRAIITVSEGADEAAWRHFLQIDTRYDFSRYEADERLKPALDFGQGLVLLAQEPFLCIMSFILSANNHFARIRYGVQQLARRYGTELTKDVYAFPTPGQLRHARAEELREHCNTGYRDRYIVDTARVIADGEWGLAAPFEMSTQEARKYLMQLPGVGPKVADCILLFAYQKADTFPVDVWMHRTMKALYWDTEATKKQVFDDAIRRFGNDAGIIQQMLFYYGKSEKLGVKPLGKK